jgi:thiamine-monophosphate kinase
MSKLSEIGEKEAVKRIIAEVAAAKDSNNIGPGDDAAAIDLGVIYLVASTDTVTQSGHVLPGMTDWQIGWMAAAVNYSDIAAMGAHPIGILISLGLPKDLESERLDALIQGVMDCSESVGAELLGGDTKEACEITIAGTSLGTVGKRSILLRKGARPGDLVGITGSLGLAAAGYHSVTKGLHLKKAEKTILEPRPRIKEGEILSSSGQVTSCMDISDGLASSIYTLAEASQVSFELQHASITVDDEVRVAAAAAGLDVNELVLYYGGDYQLLFTFKPQGLDRLQEQLGKELTVIGRVTPPGENLLVNGARVIKLDNRGYEHFR